MKGFPPEFRLTLLVNHPSGTPIYWSVQAVDNSYIGGAFAEEQVINDPLSDIDDVPGRRIVSLDNATPNPFNPSTRLAFELAGREQVRLLIYDTAGRLVRTLVDDVLESGRHETEWGGRDDDGRRVSSGMYLYRLETAGFAETKRMVMLK